MSSHVVKVCPLCGHQNLPIASFCAECDGDLMHAPVEMRRESVEPEAEYQFEPGSEVTGSSESAVVSQDALTQRVDLKPRGLGLELVSNPEVRFEVLPGQTVGRGTKADVVLREVPGLEYISRIHAQFTQRRAQWYVQYLAEGNSITVDGVESRDDAELALYEGSSLSLSFTEFRVKLM